MGLLTGDGFVATRGLGLLSWGDVGQVGSGTVTDDTGGGGTLAWTYGSDVACRVDSLGGSESLVAGRISDRSTHLITLPPGTSITSANRFRVSGGSTFEVLAVRDATDEPARFAEAVEVN